MCNMRLFLSVFTELTGVQVFQTNFKPSLCCNDRFSRTELGFAGNVQNGGKLLGRDHSAYENGNSSRFPGTRRSTSSELIRTSRIRQSLVPQYFYSRSGQQATWPLAYSSLQSPKLYKVAAFSTDWCEVLLLHKSQYLNKDTKERKKVSLKLNENYLNIPSVSTTERISKLKRRMQ